MSFRLTLVASAPASYFLGQLRNADWNALSLRAEYTERLRLRHHGLTATEQRLDQAGRKFLGANAIVLGDSGRCPTPLPSELDGDRLDLFRNPRAVNASKSQHVVATGGNGADFVFFMREHDCFEDDSVGIGDGHNCIVRPRPSANQSLALHRGHRTILTLTLSLKKAGNRPWCDGDGWRLARRRRSRMMWRGRDR